MNKNKSKVLAFLLATSMLVPSSNGIVSAADLKEDKNASIQENVQIVEEDKNQSEVNYVAMIGNQKYETLQKAFEAVPDKEQVRIVIQKDIKDLKTGDIATLEAGKSIILDMNGKTITVSSEGFEGRPIVNNGTMIVTGNGIISSENAGTTGYGAIDNYGILTIENGTYLGHVLGDGAGIKNRPGATVTINNGNFKGAATALYNEGNAYVNNGIFESESCNSCGTHAYAVTSNGANAYILFKYGNVKGVHGGIGINGGTGVIENGTFETIACKKHPDGSTSHYALYVAGHTSEVNAVVNGGSFKSVSKVAVLVGNSATEDGGNCEPANLEINGGTFIAKKASAIEVDQKVGEFTAKGGEYSSSVEDYLDPSLKTEVVSPDGMHSYYPTVSDALNKAPTGSDITDLENPPAEGTTPIEVELSDKNGTGKEFELKADKDGNVKLPIMSRSGYNFKGWRDSKTGKIYNANDVLNIKDNPDLVLEVVWEKVDTPSIPSKPIKPTYDHTRIVGSDRYETAGKIADKLGSYDTAVLVNATSTMSDGLSAAGLAGKEDAAILLVKKDFIHKATMNRLSKVKKVYIIGGENAISQKVVNQLKKNNVKVNIERLGGKTRVETSELVAKEIGNYKKAFVVNGFKGEADAMSASSVAAREEAPILLTNGKSSSTDRQSGVSYYVVGGKSVMNDSIVKKYKAERIAGDDRYETNREMINEFYGASETLYFANGETLVDALTASTIAKDDGLVLVGRKSDNKILNKKNTIQVGGMKFDVDFEK